MIANQPRTNAILPFPNTTDLSGKEGYFVTINAGVVKLYATADSLSPFGAITSGSGANTESSIAISAGGLAGTVTLEITAAAAAVVVGDYLEVSDGGTVEKDSGAGARTLVAVALEAGTAGDIIECALITPADYT
tara:strand:- start:14037 stop:14441 length:405 start_codon:yes stop_codon:yes gene_type:complete